MFRGLKLKIALFTLIPLLLVSASVSTVAIYSKYQSERQALIDRLVTYRSLLESGDLSFDTVLDKSKLKSIVGEEVVLAEILRSDYSVVFSSENSAAPLITPEEKNEVDEAARGFETVIGMNVKGKAVLSIVTPLIVDGRIVAVLHEQLSNVESSARVGQYAVLVIALMVCGFALCFLFVYVFLGRAIVDNIQRLTEATIEIQKGRLDKKIIVRTKDEIGDLAASFNIMTDRLRESRRHIDKKVKELAEEHGKLSSLVESVKLGVVMVDLRLNVIMSNGAAKTIFGKADNKALTFKDVTEKIKGRVNISQALSYYVHSGKSLNIQEVMIGDHFYRFFMSPVRDIVQKIFIGAVVVIEDITDQKKIDQMRTEIVSITSHQLRTPATIVKGNLEMVLSGDVGKISKEQKEVLGDVYMGNERMIHLINDLMDAAKISEGKAFLPLEVTDLKDLVKEVVTENKIFAEEKRVTLQFEEPTKPLSKVKVNRQKVKQVFQNLIDNAIKYSSVGDKGKVAIRIEEKDGTICFIVQDNGIGIPNADKTKIFERFARGSNSTKLDPGGGSGLGLYIAKAVIEQGGGKIWFDSKEGAGTTFYATFPKQ